MTGKSVAAENSQRCEVAVSRLVVLDGHLGGSCLDLMQYIPPTIDSIQKAQETAAIGR